MKLLITGHKGFIGQHLMDGLTEEFDVIKGIDIDDHDLREFPNPNLEKFLRSYQPNVIIHLAADFGGVLYIDSEPFEIVTNNALIQASFLKLLCSLGLPSELFVYFSSSMVYESAPMSRGPFTEDLVEDILIPRTTYGMSKLFCEKICEAAYLERGFPYAILRPFNVVGPGDAPKPSPYAHVVPTFVRRALRKDDPFMIIGGDQIRSFCDVRDLVDAVKLIVGCDRIDVVRRAFNIGSHEGIRMRELACLVWRIVNRTGNEPNFGVIAAPPLDVEYRVPDITRIVGLGWRPKYTLVQSIKEVWRWMKSDPDVEV